MSWENQNAQSSMVKVIMITLNRAADTPLFTVVNLSMPYVVSVA